MKLSILFIILLCSCQSESAYEREKTKAEKKRLALKYEHSLAFPLDVEDARNILKEGEGTFKDALIFLEGYGTPEDVPLLKDFISRVKQQDGFERINRRVRTRQDVNFEAWCQRVIDILSSPDLKKHQYEYHLFHVDTLEHARNVFKEGKGDFWWAIHFLENEGSLEDIKLLEDILERRKTETAIYWYLNEETAQRFPRVIEKIRKRHSSGKSK